MPEYDLTFGRKLAEVAEGVVAQGLEEVDAQRTVLYLSLLSTEISLKAMLEKAGVPLADIRNRSHNLNLLLMDIGQCKIKVSIGNATDQWGSAAQLRSIELIVDGIELAYRGQRMTVGQVIEASASDTSQYPNQIRYGTTLTHFSPAILAQMAGKISTFASEHWDQIRL